MTRQAAVAEKIRCSQRRRHERHQVAERADQRQQPAAADDVRARCRAARRPRAARSCRRTRRWRRPRWSAGPGWRRSGCAPCRTAGRPRPLRRPGTTPPRRAGWRAAAAGRRTSSAPADEHVREQNRRLEQPRHAAQPGRQPDGQIGLGEQHRLRHGADPARQWRRRAGAATSTQNSTEQRREEPGDVALQRVAAAQVPQQRPDEEHREGELGGQQNEEAPAIAHIGTNRSVSGVANQTDTLWPGCIEGEAGGCSVGGDTRRCPVAGAARW